MRGKLVIVSALVLAYSILEVNGACFFTGTDYSGEQVCGNGNVDLYPGPYNDGFQSVCVSAGETVILFRDDTFHGYSTVTTEDIPNLSSVGLGWALSSYITDNAACFYTQTNQGGDPYCYSSSIDLYREAPWLNDQFKSVKVPAGRQVVIFKDAYHGYGALVSSGDIDLGRYISDGISSLIVTPAPQ